MEIKLDDDGYGEIIDNKTNLFIRRDENGWTIMREGIVLVCNMNTITFRRLYDMMHRMLFDDE